MVVKYLERRQKTFPQPVHSVIEQLGDEMNMDWLAISPSQMQHVGVNSYKDWDSYKPEGIYPAHEVWNVGCEAEY